MPFILSYYFVFFCVFSVILFIYVSFNYIVYSHISLYNVFSESSKFTKDYDTMQNNKKRSYYSKPKKKKPLSFLSKILIFLGTCLIMLVLFIFCSTFIICFGPSKAARDLYVNTVMETSALKFMAKMYFTDSEIAKIQSANSAHEFSLVTDTEQIVIDPPSNEEVSSDITVEDVKGPTFVGKIMIIQDPSRIYVATVPNFNESSAGMLLTDFVSSNGAVAGINAGGFLDEGGVGKGGMPLGVVIQNGQITCNTSPDMATVVMGFDASHRLIVGNMTGNAALNSGMVEGVSFGPALVINGERVPITGSGGGLNPRTAIGQRQDGAVLLLVIDGRQAQSLGASYKDLADVMLSYGAINAGNLDGGSSSMMIYNGEVLNTRSNLVGPRRLPTAILVAPEN